MDDTTVSLVEFSCRDPPDHADVRVLRHAVWVCVVDAMFQGTSIPQIQRSRWLLEYTQCRHWRWHFVTDGLLKRATAESTVGGEVFGELFDCV